MSALRWIGTLAALLAVAAPALAAPVPEEKLTWKFKDGQTFYQTQSIEFKSVTTVQGMDINVTGKETWYFAWSFVRQNKDGTWEVRLKTLGIKLDMDVAGQKFGLDTTGKPEDDNDVGKTFRGFVGTEFTLTVTTDGQIKKFEGFKEAMDKLAKDSPTNVEAMRKFLTEDNIKQWTAVVLGGLPGKAVAKGASWKTATMLAMNPMGKIKNTNLFSLDGDKIKLKMEPEVQLSKDADLGNGVKVTKADLKPEGSGTLVYDAAKGRLSSGDIDFTIAGTLGVSANGQESELKLSQTVKMRTKFLDKNPLLEQ